MKPVLAGALACILSLAGTLVLLDPPESRVFEAVPDEDAPPVAHGLDATFEQGLDRPKWRPGYAWQVTFPRSEFTCTLVVASTGDEAYTQAASCEGAPYLAAEDAVFDYAFLGDFTPDLAGVRGSEVVQFYSWPLEDGKTWKTVWHGRTLDVTATFDPAVPGRSGPEPGFRILMTHKGEPHAAYDYVPSLAWWSDLTFANGFSMKVESLETGWRGKAVQGVAEGLLSFSSPTFVGGFTVDADHDMLVLIRQLAGPALERFQVITPGGSFAYSENRLPLGEPPGFVMSYLPSEEGAWQVHDLHVGTGSSPTTAFFGIQTRAVLV